MACVGTGRHAPAEYTRALAAQYPDRFIPWARVNADGGPDGVYTLEQSGPRFHRVGAPDVQTLERLLNRLVQRILRRLTRDGLLVEDPEQPWFDLKPSDALKQLNAASIRYRIAVGHGAGGRTLTFKKMMC